MIIVFEGNDGCGKTTQLNLTAKLLESEEVDYRHVKFPRYDKPTSSLVQMYLNGDFGTAPGSVNPYAASSFFAVDRIGSYLSDWKKDEDKVILLDRYTTSNAIHQTAKLFLPDARDFLKWLSDYEYGLLGLPKPDVVFLFSVPPEVTLANIERRGEKKDVHEADMGYMRKCYFNALWVANELGWEIIDCMDGGQMRPPEAINRDVADKLRKLNILRGDTQ